MTKWFVSIGMAVAFLCAPGIASAQDVASIDQSQGASVPQSALQLVQICMPVIDAQYRNPSARRGGCVDPTRTFFDAAKADNSAKALEKIVADAVSGLATLYRPQYCKLNRTELPQAIDVAKGYTTDKVQLAALQQIENDILNCQDVQTGAIPQERPELSPSTI